VKPLNEDREGVLYLHTFHMPDLESSADVIAEVMTSDEDRVVALYFSNATLTMRAGSWKAMFQEILEQDA
jgi:hypothetical protein